MALLFESFSSREEKTIILQKVIQNLSINNEEKDLYVFSMEILDDDDFDKFFKKILAEITTTKNL